MAEREIWGVEKIRNLFDLTGKTAIVTGGSGAFGHDAAKGLAAYGANVVVTSRRAETLEAAAKDIAERHRRQGHGRVVRRRRPRERRGHGQGDRRRVRQGRHPRHRRRPGRPHPAEEFPIDEWQKVMDSLVKGTYLCCQSAGRQMIKQGGGKIITVGSVRGELGHPGGYSAYGTAKGAVHLLTKQLATEWAKYHINVNSIAPCIFWTPLTQQVIEDPELKKIFLSRIPWGRVADPQDFIGAVVYLASAASDFVTGEILAVDGGSTAG